MFPGLLLICTLAFLLGLTLLTLALRGRRINDHPICRRCKFDLVGIYPATERCPECGRVLTHPRAVATGARRVRRGAVTLAAAILLLALGIGATAAWLRATNSNWYAIAPAWALEQLASSPSPARQTGALTELAARLDAGGLAKPRATRLLTTGLARQADRQTPWTPAWGALLDSALAAGLMSPDQFQAYCANGVDCRIDMRPKVRQHEDAEVSLYLAPDRLGPAASGTLSAPWPRVELDGREFIPSQDRGGIVISLSGAGLSLASCAQSQRCDAQLGPHTLTATAQLTISLNNAPAALASQPVVFTRDLSDTVEIVPPGTTLLTFTNDQSLAAPMRAAITIKQLEITAERDAFTTLKAQIRAQNVPMDYAFEVFIRDKAGDLHPWQGFAIRAAGASTHITSSSGDIDGLLADTAEAVLRPSEPVALAQSGINESWGGELVIKDVPVIRPNPQPADPVPKAADYPADKPTDNKDTP